MQPRQRYEGLQEGPHWSSRMPSSFALWAFAIIYEEAWMAFPHILPARSPLMGFPGRYAKVLVRSCMISCIFSSLAVNVLIFLCHVSLSRFLLWKVVDASPFAIPPASFSSLGLSASDSTVFTTSRILCVIVVDSLISSVGTSRVGRGGGIWCECECWVRVFFWSYSFPSFFLQVIRVTGIGSVLFSVAAVPHIGYMFFKEAMVPQSFFGGRASRKQLSTPPFGVFFPAMGAGGHSRGISFRARERGR